MASQQQETDNNEKEKESAANAVALLQEARNDIGQATTTQPGTLASYETITKDEGTSESSSK